MIPLIIPNKLSIYIKEHEIEIREYLKKLNNSETNDLGLLGFNMDTGNIMSVITAIVFISKQIEGLWDSISNGFQDESSSITDEIKELTMKSFYNKCKVLDKILSCEPIAYIFSQIRITIKPAKTRALKQE